MMATGQDFKKIVNQVNFKRNTIEQSPSKRVDKIEDSENQESKGLQDEGEDSSPKDPVPPPEDTLEQRLTKKFVEAIQAL